MSDDQPEIGTRAGESSSSEPWWTTSVGLTKISATIVLILAASAVLIGVIVDPLDDANYVIAAVAVAVAALNVLFTLWLLRTAQRQLVLMRRQADEQHDNSLKQIEQTANFAQCGTKEAGDQLNSLHEQLELAREAHLAERHEADTSFQISREAVDEALKARLDQLAPHVSLAVETITLILKKRKSATEVETITILQIQTT